MMDLEKERDPLDTVPEVEPTPSDMNPMVVQYLANKYPERLAKLMQDRQAATKDFDQKNSDPGMGKRLAMGLAAALSNKKSFGDISTDERTARASRRENVLKPFTEQEKALRGEMDVGKEAFDVQRSGVEMQRGLKKDKREDIKFEAEQAEEATLKDPNSPQSKNIRALAKKMSPGGSFEGLSGKEMIQLIPSLEKLYKIDQDRLARQDSNQARRDLLNEKNEMKKETAENKKKISLNEVEDRKRNILDAVGELETMIDADGTFELFGSHNQTLDRLIDQIATDMAKLQDPNSVARPGEVELVKRQLIQSGFKNKNSTAKDLLSKFKGEVERRASTAYKVRGIDEPSYQATKPGEAKGKKPVQKQFSKSRNQTKITYDDGSEEILDGQK